MMQDVSQIEGYHAPIHRAVWERILTMGAPRILSALWLAGCAYAALVFLTVLGVVWGLVPIGAYLSI